MAANRWISNSSTDLNTGGNWSSGAALANGDSPVFSDYGTANATTNATQAGDTYPDCTVDEGYTGDIGASGAPFTPVQITRLNYRGSGRMYVAGALPTIVCDSPSTKDDALVITGTAIASMSVLRGKATLASGGATAASGIVEISGTGQLTINTGTTITAGSQFRISGDGILIAYVDPLAVYCDGNGRYYHGTETTGGSHALTLAEFGDGHIFYYSTGTAAKVRARKSGRGSFTLGNEYAREVTSMEAWAGPKIDLRKGKHCTIVITAKDCNEPLNILWPLNTTITPS